MKKLIYLAAIASALLVGGCSDDDSEAVIIVDPEVEASSSKVLFDEKGGTKTVYVGTNCDEWNFVCDDEWLSVARNGNELTLKADPNTKADKQDAVIYITAYLNDVVDATYSNRADTRIDVRQLGTTSVADLSAGGTSNCYMAHTGTDYKFSATVKGNGKSDGNSRYIETCGLNIEGIGYADLVWEATFDGDKTRSCRIIDGAPFYNDGYIYFSTGNVEGNALIAARTNSGEILWSWHIWVSNEPVTLSEFNGVSWMDRNLGALNNEPGDMNNRGMFYQWGRKDPFLPSAVEYMEVGANNIPAANVLNNQVGEGSGRWAYTGVKAKKASHAPGNIPASILIPTTYLLPFSTFSDWYITTPDTEDQPASYLWGGDSTGMKTISDPCPAGYMVPANGAFATTLTNSSKYVDLKAQWSAGENHGRYWTDGNGQFFPFTGLLTTTNTPLTYCGAMGTYWTAACVELAAGSSRRLYMNDNFVNYNAGARVYGASVRCVKEK